MKIAIFGTGYVGLVTGACFANSGVDVVCVDVVKEKIKDLKNGKCPIHEKDLPARLEEGIRSGKLQFTTSPRKALSKCGAIFITVGTPPQENGTVDLSAVLKVAKTIGKLLCHNCIIVQKSTAPVGIGDKINKIIAGELAKRKTKIHHEVISNPEFLKEGNAVKDFESPSRVIIGTKNKKAGMILKKLYQPFMRKKERIFMMDRKSAELVKYAANTMLATRISFMNILARLAEEVGADIKDVRVGIGSDARIGAEFLFPGVGFGGSCFPKDIRALIEIMSGNSVDPGFFQEVLKINMAQRTWFVSKIFKAFPNINEEKFAVWGLAFKGGTDDVREAPSIDIIEAILNAGGGVIAYDPHAVHEFQSIFGKKKKLEYGTDQYKILKDCSALIVLTDELGFRNPDFQKVAGLLKNSPTVFDGRNLYDPKELAKKGIRYFCVGRTQ